MPRLTRRGHFVPNYCIYWVYSVFMLPAEVPEKEILQTVKMWVFTQVRKLFPLNQGSAPFGGGSKPTKSQ